MAVQWHWTKTQAALPFAVSTAAFAVMMVFAGRAQDRLGPRKVARVNYGPVFTGFGIAGVFGSLLGGRVRDLFGSYDKAYLICGIMLLVAAGLAWLVRAPRLAAEPR